MLIGRFESRYGRGTQEVADDTHEQNSAERRVELAIEMKSTVSVRAQGKIGGVRLAPAIVTFLDLFTTRAIRIPLYTSNLAPLNRSAAMNRRRLHGINMDEQSCVRSSSLHLAPISICQKGEK